jgi:hypothetical protein
MASAKKLKKEFQYHRKEIEVPGPEEEPYGKGHKKIRYTVPIREAEIVGNTARGWGWGWDPKDGNCLGLRKQGVWGRKLTPEEEELNLIAEYLKKVDWAKVGERAIRAFLERHPKLVEIYIRDTKA